MPNSMTTTAEKERHVPKALTARGKLEGRITVPTGAADELRHTSFHHLMPHLRTGKISAEVWSRKNRERIPVDPDVEVDLGEAKVTVPQDMADKMSLGGRRVKEDASEKPKAAKVGVRREGRSVGKKAPLQSTEKAKSRKKAQKKVMPDKSKRPSRRPKGEKKGDK